MPLILYTTAEATQYFNKETRLSLREETLRNLMKSAKLTIHKVGNIDLIAKGDLD